MSVQIVTSRLVLRRFTQADLPALADLFADTAVQEYLAVGLLGPRGAREFAASFIRASDDEWREGGCGVLAMVPRGDEDGGNGARDHDPDQPRNTQLIGYCGLRHLPDRVSAVEIVYALAQDRWGQGLAAEAARAALAWGFDNLDVREILAFTRPPRAGSWKRREWSCGAKQIVTMPKCWRFMPLPVQAAE